MKITLPGMDDGSFAGYRVRNHVAHIAPGDWDKLDIAGLVHETEMPVPGNPILKVRGKVHPQILEHDSDPILDSDDDLPEHDFGHPDDVMTAAEVREFVGRGLPPGAMSGDKLKARHVIEALSDLSGAELDDLRDALDITRPPSVSDLLDGIAMLPDKQKAGLRAALGIAEPSAAAVSLIDHVKGLTDKEKTALRTALGIKKDGAGSTGDTGPAKD